MKPLPINRLWREHANQYQSVSKTKREYVPASEREGFDESKIEVLPGPESTPHRRVRANVSGFVT